MGLQNNSVRTRHDQSYSARLQNPRMVVINKTTKTMEENSRILEPWAGANVRMEPALFVNMSMVVVRTKDRISCGY